MNFLRRRGQCALCAALLALLALTSPPAIRSVGAEPASEVWLGLVVNFARYAQWPSESTPQAMRGWHFCFARGQNSSDADAGRLQDTQLYELPVQVRYVTAKDELTGCHLLYIPARVQLRQSQRLLQSSRDMPLLTISDRAGFIDGEGMIELVADGDRYHFDVAYDRVRQARMSLSSSMLQLARHVY